MPFGLRLSSRAQDKLSQRLSMVEGYARVFLTPMISYTHATGAALAP